MAIEISDINLQKFLEKFTFTQDPNPGTKIILDTALFLQIASLLKLDWTLENLRSKIR